MTRAVTAVHESYGPIPSIRQIAVDVTLVVLNDYRINGKRSLPELNRPCTNTYFRGRRLASITTADVRAYIAHRQGQEFVARHARRVRTAMTGALNRRFAGGPPIGFPRLPPHRGTEPRAGRGAAECGDGDGRSQDRGHLAPIRHRQRARPVGRGAAARRRRGHSTHRHRASRA
jgi:hypothetical protein